MKCHSDAADWLIDPVIWASLSAQCAKEIGLSVFIQVIYIQIGYSFVCKRRISLAILLQLWSKADETIPFCVPVNSHLRFHICISQAFGKTLPHTFSCLWKRLPPQLGGTQCNLHVVLRYQLFKLWGKVLLGGNAEKLCFALWSQWSSLIWVGANETSSWANLCLQLCTKSSPGSALPPPSHQPAVGI